MTKQLALLIATASILAFPTSGMAKVFRNTYVSFELPNRWDCHIEGTEWICNSLLKEASREAIIILTAKELGPADNFATYEQHLRTPKRAPNSRGQAVVSQVKHLKRRNINNHPWVDAMHLGSEIPNYYTRYLATTKGRLAILVTFSAHQRHFTKYSNDFFRAIESLQVMANADTFQNQALAPVRPGSETLGNAAPPPLAAGETNFEDFPDEPKGSPLKNILALMVLVGALGGYFYIKKQKAKK